MGRYTLPTYALLIARLAALAVIVGATDFVMRLAVGSIHTDWATRLSSAWERQLTPALNSLL